MAVYNRDRDFTNITLSDIRENLIGDNMPYKELSNWWASNGSAFDYADPTEDIQYLENYMTELRFFISGQVPKALDTIETNVRQIDTSYAVKTNAITDEVRTYGRIVDILVASISAPDFAVSFDKAAVWGQIALIAPGWKIHRTEAELFITNIVEQYGFDRQTATSMWRIYQTLRVRYPHFSQEELDWKFSRVISALSYPGNIDEYSLAEQVMFNSCAGDAFDGFSEGHYYISVLGMSKSEYLWFRYKVRVQNFVSAPQNAVLSNELTDIQIKNYKASMEAALGRTITYEEFATEWNRQVRMMGGKTDLAHHFYIIASNLAVDLDKNYYPSEYIFGDEQGVKELTGWLGDATLPPYAFGPDDYKADLDASNILYYMDQKNMSYSQASSFYYGELQAGRVNRASTFLTHTPISHVVDSIFFRLGVKSIGEVKDKYPDAYNFIVSLQRQQNEMVD